MKILIFGDVYGRIGRKALIKQLPILQKKYNPDFIVVNVDNITSGRGAILKHIQDLKEAGVHIMTTGDHLMDNYNSISELLEKDNSLLVRPINFFESEFCKIKGTGYTIKENNGKKLLLIHAMGQVFTKYRLDNPFLKINDLLLRLEDENFDGIIIDFHKEATSEGYGMAKFLDGRISLVYGTHTHVQTNDEQISEFGTGLISDVGMNGVYNSVIGADYDSVEKMFLTGISIGKLKQSLDKNYIINGIYVEIGEDKKCEKIEKIRIKGKL